MGIRHIICVECVECRLVDLIISPINVTIFYTLHNHTLLEHIFSFYQRILDGLCAHIQFAKTLGTTLQKKKKFLWNTRLFNDIIYITFSIRRDDLYNFLCTVSVIFFHIFHTRLFCRKPIQECYKLPLSVFLAKT